MRPEIRNSKSEIRNKSEGPKGEIGREKPSADGEPFITKEEVARRMRKPVRGIEEWMRRGIVPFYKVGQAVRFRWSEVQAQFARRYRVEAEAERAVTSEQ
jgi:excisionase family DNA binding protein